MGTKTLTRGYPLEAGFKKAYTFGNLYGFKVPRNTFWQIDHEV